MVRWCVGGCWLLVLLCKVDGWAPALQCASAHLTRAKRPQSKEMVVDWLLTVDCWLLVVDGSKVAPSPLVLISLSSPSRVLASLFLSLRDIPFDSQHSRQTSIAGSRNQSQIAQRTPRKHAVP